jgi:hypothetical protein
MFEIKVGFLVSYDYKYLYTSLPLVYEDATLIVLAIDQHRVTWSGIPFTIDQEFFEWLNKIDQKKKITIYEDDFFVPELSTSDCDTRERNMLASKMGSGGWHIQIDSDEYFLDFKSFVCYLRSNEKIATKEPVHVFTRFITLYKKVKEGYLVVSVRTENIATATNKPEYLYIRNVKDVRKINSSHIVIHQSWARDEDEIAFKIKSWGHSTDFDVNSYFKLWNAIDYHNYHFLLNYHPLTPTAWPKLEFIASRDISELLDYFRKKNFVINRTKWFRMKNILTLFKKYFLQL